MATPLFGGSTLRSVSNTLCLNNKKSPTQHELGLFLSTTTGEHLAFWCGLDEAGQSMASGVYIMQMQADGQIQTGRLALVK